MLEQVCIEPGRMRPMGSPCLTVLRADGRNRDNTTRRLDGSVWLHGDEHTQH